MHNYGIYIFARLRKNSLSKRKRDAVSDAKKGLLNVAGFIEHEHLLLLGIPFFITVIVLNGCSRISIR